MVDDAPALGEAMAASAVSTKAMREAALYLTGFPRRHVYGAGIELHPRLSSIGFAPGLSTSQGR